MPQPKSLWKHNWMLKLFAITKIPLIFYVRPRILQLDADRCEVVIPLRYRTRNHVNSMYFGALAIGVDLAGGTFVLDAIQASGRQVDFIFKDFTATFLKLAKGDVHFICAEGEKVRQVVADTIASGTRANATVAVIATTPAESGNDPIATFTLTISVKVRG